MVEFLRLTGVCKPSVPSLLLAFACRRSTETEKPASWIERLLRRCFCDDDFLEKLGVGRVVEAKFVAKTLLDPIRVLRTAR